MKNYLKSLAPDGGDKGYWKWLSVSFLLQLICCAFSILTDQDIFIAIEYGIGVYIIIVAIDWIINEIEKINTKYKI